MISHAIARRGEMDDNQIEIRRKRYFHLSSQIARLDNVQLHSLLENSGTNEPNTGWGSNHTIVLGESKVFVKRLPVTNIEYENLFSTKNLYNLPICLNYGFDSTGFGVFRELVTCIKTTNWVLEGTIATFPLMYHYRIIPSNRQRGNLDRENLKSCVENCGNNENVGRYLLDRAIANYELVLFLEYVPYVLETWLYDNPSQLQQSLNDLRRTIDFLRSKGIIHFDAHFRNILTDGKQIYLTDFGLALDRSFALSASEELFWESNTFYDYGEILRNLRHPMRLFYESCSQSRKGRIREKYAIAEDLKSHELVSILIANIEQIHAEGDMNLDDFYVASILKYRSIIILMHNFFSQMWVNKNKDTIFPNVELGLLLTEVGLIC